MHVEPIVMISYSLGGGEELSRQSQYKLICNNNIILPLYFRLINLTTYYKFIIIQITYYRSVITLFPFKLHFFMKNWNLVDHVFFTKYVECIFLISNFLLGLYPWPLLNLTKPKKRMKTHYKT